MPLDGNGAFTPVEPQFPAIPNTVILAEDYNDIWNDAATAISTAIFRDGQSTIIADIPFNAHKITELAAGTLNTDATNFDQVFHNPNFVGSVGDGVVISGTKGTITATDFIVNSDNFTSNNDTISLNSAVSAALNSVAITLDGSTSILLDAPTINMQGTSINITGATTASLTSGTTGVTQSAGDGSTKLATTQYVDSAVIGGSFPIGVGNNRKVVSQNAGVILWDDKLDATIMKFTDSLDTTKQFHFWARNISTGTNREVTIPNADFDMVGHNTVQTLTNKTITIDDSKLTIQNVATPAKKIKYDLANLSAVTRTITPKDENIKLFTGGLELLYSNTFSTPGLTFEVDMSSILSSSFDQYLIVIDDFTRENVGATNRPMGMQVKIGGSYIGGGYLSGASSDSLYLAGQLSKNSADQCSAWIIMNNPRSTTKWKTFLGMAMSGSDSVATNGMYADRLQNVGAITGFQIGVSSAFGNENVATANVHIFGIRKT